MSPTERGRLAESAAAAHLEALGWVIVARNWRTRWCELDIIGHTPAGIHFVEVKYRRQTTWGDGFAAITHDKAQRLTRAALAWCQAHSYSGDYQIDAMSLSGELDQPTIEYLPNVIGW